MRRGVEIREATPADAEVVTAVIHRAFAGRPVLDPPATALDETVASVAEALERSGGLLATVDGEPAGALLLDPRGELLGLRRVGVVPQARGAGVASALSSAAAAWAEQRGLAGLELEARAELPEAMAFWRRQGYAESARVGARRTMLRLLPVEVLLPEPADTQALGERLAGGLRAGDLLILTGDLGAGKTTFTQGLGRGLGVRGAVTSPTFVIARVHPAAGPAAAGPALVHVDAYRLGDGAELDDLDLDADLDRAVTVVEWGAGLAESLADERLELDFHRDAGDAQGETRTVRITPVGARWRELRRLLRAPH